MNESLNLNRLAQSLTSVAYASRNLSKFSVEAVQIFIRYCWWCFLNLYNILC